MKSRDLQADLDQLREDDLLTEVLGELKSGKEATVYLVRHHDRLMALKHYRPMLGRHFATSAKYREGRHMRDRDARAFAKRTRFGRRLAQGTWIGAEYRALRRVWRVGVPVPKALVRAGASILMEFVAEAPDSNAPAPRMIDIELTPAEAGHFHAVLMRAVIRMMQCHVVHADLSPYNVLVTTDASGKRNPIIIDFPQAVDPRGNRVARELLEHDVGAITSFCTQFNEAISDHQLVPRLWKQFEEGQLGDPPNRRPSGNDTSA